MWLPLMKTLGTVFCPVFSAHRHMPRHKSEKKSRVLDNMIQEDRKKTVPNADSGKVKMINGEILFCLHLK